MKVAFILPSLAYKGPIIIAQSIVMELYQIIDIDVYYFDDIVETDFPVKTTRIKFWERIPYEEYDAIHTHMFRPDMYLFLWSKFLFKKKILKITTIHQFIDHDFSNQHSLFKAKLASRIWHSAFCDFDVLVTLNALMEGAYKLKFPNKIVSKIHNGIAGINIRKEIPDDDAGKIEDFRQNYVCLGAAAQITKNKGFHQVIKLLAINKEVCFVLIGDGKELVNLKSLAVENNTIDRVLFLGKRNNAKKYFPYFDIFLMTSEMEGFPVALLEAASLSIPSICTNNKIFRDIFSEEEVAFFERDNIPSLNKAVEHTLKNESEFRRNINRRFKDKYTSQSMANNYLKLYKNKNFEKSK